MEPTTYGWLVLAFPLAGSLLIAFGYRVLPVRSAGWIGTAAIGLSFLSSLGMLTQLLDLGVHERQLTNSLYDYASAGGLDIQLNVLVDPLSVYMCLIVSGISTMIHLYSISYVTTDRVFNRFFSYLNFFVFSMLLLVLAGNIVLLIVGWAFVGFASYALISFWYRRTTATTRITGMNSRSMMKFSPMFPTSASPHVFRNSDSDRPTAVTGPTFSTTSTGTTFGPATSATSPRGSSPRRTSIARRSIR